MIRSFFILVGILSISLINAQAQSKPHFNHTTIYVTDLNRAADFYEKALELERIAEPFHDNKHVWFRMGDHDQLHVVSGAKEVSTHDTPGCHECKIWQLGRGCEAGAGATRQDRPDLSPGPRRVLDRSQQ